MVGTLICILIGTVAGVSGGLFGIGGGIIIVPALVLFAGFEQQKAQGTSLVALLLPIGLPAVINYYRANNADLVKGACLALGFLVGAYSGSKLAIGLDPVTMRKSFAVFLGLIAAYTWFQK